MFSFKERDAWQDIGDRTEAVLRDYAQLHSEAVGTAREFEEAQSAIQRDGVWSMTDEWRISTSFDVRIEKMTKEDRELFYVTVSCDGQKFECECPTLDRAHLFSKWYRHLIVRQFYSIGPNWSARAKK